mmetsp:Transcript_33809/g.55820  ORF Transcript_33809/g.55820 Transcript_33809/m.55820 type:complete len:228 (-) Transcript_33809:121-804(-)
MAAGTVSIEVTSTNESLNFICCELRVTRGDTDTEAEAVVQAVAGFRGCRIVLKADGAESGAATAARVLEVDVQRRAATTALAAWSCNAAEEMTASRCSITLLHVFGAFSASNPSARPSASLPHATANCSAAAATHCLVGPALRHTRTLFVVPASGQCDTSTSLPSGSVPLRSADGRLPAMRVAGAEARWNCFVFELLSGGGTPAGLFGSGGPKTKCFRWGSFWRQSA